MTQEVIPGHNRRRCPDCKTIYSREWRLRHPEYERLRYKRDITGTLQEAAKKEVYKAVRAGKLPKASTLRCIDCGLPAFIYDHRDYTKPLDVVPVCRRCNHKRGAAR